MPAIRDFTSNYTTSTTGTTIVLDVPSYRPNDLLLAIITADTGTGTWSASGWNVLFSQVNTCQQVVLWRIATSGEPANYTFTRSAGETFTGVMLSIQDVNTTNPFGSPALYSVQNQSAAAKYAFQQITTNVNNTLILYVASNSSVGVPSIIEGPVYGLLGNDGSAESMGIGWSFKSSTGATPSNVVCSNVGSGAGVKSVIQIAPPASGATIIPAFCTEDTSLYLNPLNGTTAYNGDTAVAATADTNFGTSFTTAKGTFTGVDATVAAVGDTGINSYHSSVQLTSAASTNMSGAELVFAAANRPDLTNKNLLCHVQVSTPITLQRLGIVESLRGVWIGFRSGTLTDYKIYQVLGSDSPGAASRPVPVVVNPSANTHVSSAGTYNPASTLAVGFWNDGNPIGGSVVQYLQMWVLGRTTVCGGNAAFPIGIPEIAAVVAKGHERISAIRQGSSQLLCLQHVKFGNAGAEPTYLLLDSTAIEFPEQYNPSKKIINYHSVDNAVGLEYEAGPNDTIIHRNSVVSSASKFFWVISASSSPLATYDFSGLSIIGAGIVTLRDVTTFQQMTFNKCPSISQNGATITNCAFINSIIVDANPGKISDCSFTATSSGQHAIVITQPGTYTFSGNTFTGYGANGTTSAAIYNNSGGAVTINIAGGGDVPTVRNGTGASTTVVAASSVQLTGLQPDSEVRAYLGTSPETATEIAGVENSGTSFSFSHSYSGQQGYIQIFHLEYQPVLLPITYASQDVSIPIQQIRDRQYDYGSV